MTPSLLWFDVSSPTPGSGFYVDGDVQLNFRSLMKDKTDYTMIDQPLNFTKAVSPASRDLNWANVMSAYRDQRVRTEFVSDPPLWSGPRASLEPFVIQIKARIPTQRIIYRPAFLEVLKNGWIQYLSMLVLVALIFVPIYDLMITNQVVRTVVQVEPRTGKDLKVPTRY